MVKTEARKTKKSTKIYIDIEIHIIAYTELSFFKKVMMYMQRSCNVRKTGKKECPGSTL